MTATTNLMNAEVKKPQQTSKSSFEGRFRIGFVYQLARINAPTKGPIIRIPPGIGARSPTMSPTEVVPIIPALVPPNFLVPSAGIM